MQGCKIAALSTIGQNWEQPKWLSGDTKMNYGSSAQCDAVELLERMRRVRGLLFHGECWVQHRTVAGPVSAKIVQTCRDSFWSDTTELLVVIVSGRVGQRHQKATAQVMCFLMVRVFAKLATEGAAAVAQQ